MRWFGQKRIDAQSGRDELPATTGLVEELLDNVAASHAVLMIIIALNVSRNPGPAPECGMRSVPKC
jgi:hypothetical protein